MQLEDYISRERLNIYSSVLKLKSTDQLAGYNWNKALSSAMQPLMHCLEVTLRNSIDQAIRNMPPMNPVRPWLSNHNWIFDLPRYQGDKRFKQPTNRYRTDQHGQLLDGTNGRKLEYKKSLWEENQIRDLREKFQKENRSLTSERFIASLSFGFWTNLLSNAYEDTRHHMLLWPTLLPEVFPGAPFGHGIGRQHIEQQFIRIRELRNRLAHHEAIWKFNQLDPVSQKPNHLLPVYGLGASLNLLNSAWHETLEALRWLSPDRHKAFLASGHHRRFEALANKDGLLSFVEQSKVSNTLNIRRSIRYLLWQLEHGNIVRVNNGDHTYAVFGPDFIQRGMKSRKN